MKVLLLIDSLGSGGAQRQMLLLAKGLVARGHAVSLLNYYPAIDHFRAELESYGVAIVDIEKPSRWSLAPVFAIRRVAASGDFDIALSFLTTPNVYLILACRLLGKLPVIVSERYTFSSDKLSLASQIVYRIYRLASMVTTNSNHQRNAVARHFPALRSRLATIYNGVDTVRFVPRQAADSSQKGLSLVAVGSVASKKNSYGLAQAVDVCLSRGMNIVVQWAGVQQTSNEGSAAFERTNELLKSRKIDRHWQWLGEQPEIEKIMAHGDVVIHPSFFEGLPNVVCEALACGKIVLASDVGDHKELLGDGQRGFCFDPADPISIADAIERVVGLTDEERRTMEYAARDYAVNELGVERYVGEYEKLMRDCIAQDERLKA